MYIVVDHANRFHGVFTDLDDARELTLDAPTHYIIDEVVLRDAVVVVEQDD